MIILQIIGGIVVAIVVFVILVFLYLRIKFGKLIYADTNHEPYIIHLNQDIDPQWIHNKKVKTLIESMESFGFNAGEPYFIQEMKDVYLLPFFNDCICALIYQHPVVDTWVEMVLLDENGTEYNVSNQTIGSSLEAPENIIKFIDPSLSIQNIFDKIQEIIKSSDVPLITIDDHNFRDFFENSYKKESAWRARKGGVSYEEFVKLSQENKIKISTKNTRQAFIDSKVTELYHWQEAALEHYYHENNITNDDYYSQDLFIVPFCVPAESLITYLVENDFIDESQEHKYAKVYAKHTDPFKMFDEINAHLSQELRAQFITEQDFPLKLKIYQLPEISLID